MKAVCLSLVLLLILLVGTVWNHIYINKVANALESMLRELPEMQSSTCRTEAEALLAYWEEQSVAVGLSIPYPLTDRITEQAKLLCICAACGDRFGFEAARVLLSDAIEDMRHLERFSIENLL